MAFVASVAASGGHRRWRDESQAARCRRSAIARGPARTLKRLGEALIATYLYDRDDVDSTPGVSIVLGFKQTTITRPDGETDRMPSLKGISGCGIWRLYGHGDQLGRLDTWDPGWIRLAGIEHGCVDRKYIKGTLMKPVLKFIERANPDLVARMRLILCA